MYLFRMRNFLLISLLVFIIDPSIGAKVTRLDTNAYAEDTNIKWSPVFPDTFHKGFFRMSFDISSNHITGFLIIKKTSDSSVNIVFTNEFGVCFFYFEFCKGQFQIHTLFPSFNRKALLSLLEQDFRMILFPDTTIKKITVLQSTENETSILKVYSQRSEEPRAASG